MMNKTEDVKKGRRTGVIAFCGSKGSGKSTSAQIFNRVYGGPVEELAIAGKLKEVSSEVFGIDMRYFIEPSLKEVELDTYIHLKRDQVDALYDKFNVPKEKLEESFVRSHVGNVFDTPRKLLQYIGSELLHPIDPNIHVKNMCLDKNKEKLTLITDLRFNSEFNYLKDLYGSLFVPIYVKNPKAEEIAKSDNHPSERQLFDFCHKCRILDNQGSLFQLEQSIKDIVEEDFGG